MFCGCANGDCSLSLNFLFHGPYFCLSRLTAFLPSPQDLIGHHPAQQLHKRAINLDKDCDDLVNLLSKAEFEDLKFSLVGIPALVVGAYKKTMGLTCAIVKI